MGMRRRTLRKRRTCGRWRVIDGRRQCCPYTKGHEDECRPYRRAADARRREELSALFLQHDTDDVACDGCAAARRAIDGGCAAGYVLALRCDWARGVLRSLYEAHNLGDMFVPGEVEIGEQQ